MIFQNWRRSNAGIATDESFEKAPKKSFVMKSKIEIPFFNIKFGLIQTLS